MVTNEDMARQMAQKWLEDKNLAAMFEICKIEAHGNVFLVDWHAKDGSPFPGNAPLLVDISRKLLFGTGSAYPTEYFLNNYRITGDPRIKPVKRIKISPGSGTVNKTSALLALKDNTSLSLVAAKEIIDSILEGKTISVPPRIQTDAEEMAARLKKCGLLAEVELCAPENKSD